MIKKNFLIIKSYMFQGLYEMLIILSLLRQDVGDGQGGLACCDSWGRKESDTTERLI